MKAAPDRPSGWERFYRVVRRIPRGRVTTYGRVAAMAGRPGAARQVGYALAALRGKPGAKVPWQRVLGQRGPRHAGISLPPDEGGERQRALLEAERIIFDARGRIELARFGWSGPGKPVRR